MISQFFTTVDEFLFYREDPYKVAVFRILLGTVLLLNLLLLAGNLEAWFTSEGLFPVELIRQRSHPLTFSLFFWNDSLEFITSAYVVLHLATLSYILGIYPRLCAILMWVLTVSFHHRNPELFHAGDMLLRFVLFINIFLDSGKAYSLVKPKRSPASVPGWPLRVIQIQLCILYFFAAASKTGSSMWMNGEHVYAMLNFPGRAFFDFYWLREFPVMTSLLTYSIIGIEMSFPFLVWYRKLRIWIVGSAFLMHLGILLTINVIYFSEIMFVLLFTFVDLKSKRSTE